jgi:hypothetical protein
MIVDNSLRNALPESAENSCRRFLQEVAIGATTFAAATALPAPKASHPELMSDGV